MPSCSVCGFSWCGCKGPGKVLDGKTYCVKCYEYEMAKRGLKTQSTSGGVTNVSVSGVSIVRQDVGEKDNKKETDVRT